MCIIPLRILLKDNIMVVKTDSEIVSAVITTRNRLKYLKRAIDSVFSQTYSNIECIIVSDASTDGTDDYCKSRSDIRFISIPHKESRGGNYARNLGIKASKGKYIAFLDDDDYWLPTKIEKQLALIEEKRCECVYCLRLIEFVKNGIVSSKRIESKNYKLEGDLSHKIFRHWIASTSCLMVSKQLLDTIGGFDENLYKNQEYELMIRIAQLTPIYYYNSEPLVVYTSNKYDPFRIKNDPGRLFVAKKYIETKHRSLLKKSGIVNRFLYADWMVNALYPKAVKIKRYRYCIIYGPYYLCSRLIHFIHSKL